jgi:hypothetical protein
MKVDRTIIWKGVKKEKYRKEFSKVRKQIVRYYNEKEKECNSLKKN